MIVKLVSLLNGELVSLIGVQINGWEKAVGISLVPETWRRVDGWSPRVLCAWFLAGRMERIAEDAEDAEQGGPKRARKNEGKSWVRHNQ